MPRQRYHVEARDVPPVAAARMLGLTEERFTQLLPDLIKRRFPSADETTGNFDRKAIEKWQDARHPALIHSESPPLQPAAPSTTRDRMRMLATGQ